MTSYSSKKENARLGYWRRQFKKNYKALRERHESNLIDLNKSQEEKELNHLEHVADLTSKLASSQGDLLRSSMHFLAMTNQTQRATTKTIDHLIASIEEAYKQVRNLRRDVQTLKKNVQEKGDLLKKVKEKATERAKGLNMIKEILRVQDKELAKVNSKMNQNELELLKARSKVRDLEKDLMTRQTQEPEKIGQPEPRKEITYFRVTRNIVKEEVPFKRFKFQTNYEPRRLLSYIQLATTLSGTSEQWQEFEDKLNEGAFNGIDLLLERNGDSLEQEETVESEKSNDSNDCDSDSSGGDNYIEDSENPSDDHRYPVNPRDYNGDDDGYNGDNDDGYNGDDDKYPEKAKGDNKNTANSNNDNGDDSADSNSDNPNDDIGSDDSNYDIGSDDYDIGSDNYDSDENYNDR